MKAVVIYDENGTIWAIRYEDAVPSGLPYLIVDIPDGAAVARVENGEPVFVYQHLEELPLSVLAERVKRGEISLNDLPSDLRNNVRIVMGV